MVGAVIRRILVPVELSESAQPDLNYAIGLAAQLRAELILLAVVDTATTVQLIGRHKAIVGGGSDFEDALLEEVKSTLRDAVDVAAQKGVRALGHVKIGEEVDEEILKEALLQRVDLILVRSVGRSGLMKTLLGNTAGEILKAAPCPVLVARA